MLKTPLNRLSTVSVKPLLCLLLLTGCKFLNAQATCDCRSDLSYLNDRIQKTPAYKIHQADYEAAYRLAMEQSGDTTPLFKCFEIVNKLLLSLQDWHMSAVEPGREELSDYQISYPLYTKPIDELQKQLMEQAPSAIEGIYHIGQRLVYGLVYDKLQKHYLGVVLSSRTALWNKGDVILKLIPVSETSFKLIGAQFPTKRLISYTERIDHGMFLRSGFRKDTSTVFYNKSPFPEDQFLFKDLDSQIHYLKVGSFSSYHPLLGEAETFYQSLEGQLNKAHLILDLRDNGGGGDRNSDLLFKLLKPYLKKHSVHIITNASTGSNAEQFTLKLKAFDRVHTYGDRTRGALAYEIKPDDYLSLPSSQFTVVLTSKVFKKYLPYETRGITPDHLLDYKRSWIDAVVNIIKEGSP